MSGDGFRQYDLPDSLGEEDYTNIEDDPFLRDENLGGLSAEDRNRTVGLVVSVLREREFNRWLSALLRESRLHFVSVELQLSSNRLHLLRKTLHDNIVHIIEVYSMEKHCFKNQRDFLSLLIIVKLNFHYMADVVARSMLKASNITFLLVFVGLELLVGAPLYLVQLAIGQYGRRCPGKCWLFSPVLRGAGYSCAFTAAIILGHSAYLHISALPMLVDTLMGVRGWTDSGGRQLDEATTAAFRNVTCSSLNLALRLNYSLNTTGRLFYLDMMERMFYNQLSHPNVTGIVCIVVFWLAVFGLVYQSFETFVKVSKVVILGGSGCLIFLIVSCCLYGPATVLGLSTLFTPSTLSVTWEDLEGGLVCVVRYSLLSCISMGALSPPYSSPQRMAVLKSVLESAFVLLFSLLAYTAAGHLMARYNTKDLSCFADPVYIVNSLIPSYLNSLTSWQLYTGVYLFLYLVFGVVAAAQISYILQMSLCELVTVMDDHKFFSILFVATTSVFINIALHFGYGGRELVDWVSDNEAGLLYLMYTSLILVLQSGVIFLYSVDRLLSDVHRTVGRRPSDYWMFLIHATLPFIVVTFVLTVAENLGLYENIGILVSFVCLMFGPLVITFLNQACRGLRKNGKFWVDLVDPDWAREEGRGRRREEEEEEEDTRTRVSRRQLSRPDLALDTQRQSSMRRVRAAVQQFHYTEL